MVCCSVTGNEVWSGRRKALEAFGQQAGTFRAIGREVVHDLLDGGTKRSEGGVGAITCHRAPHKLPQALDQVVKDDLTLAPLYLR